MNKTKEISYPRFITDKPQGEDLYTGQSQNTIAENIKIFITENSQKKRKVIGIEGEWGSGKSNVIEILKKKLIEDYYFFVFDAWGHQEDLTRRSILEELLDKLIKNKELNNHVKWENELKILLAKKVDKITLNVPELNWFVIFSFIGVLLTTVSKYAADAYLKTYTTQTTNPNIWQYLTSVLIYLIPFVPVLILIINSLGKVEKSKRKEEFAKLFTLFKGEKIETVSSETISENEPSVKQFTDFLTNIEKDCSKTLVIVFDNMDRLPSKNVKQVWSSIHTFFAIDDNDIKTWAIVPFDNEHICNIFIEGNNNNEKHRADSYIHKTFSIVFHVPPPVQSDWKKVIFTKFKEAFGFEPPPGQHIETIFDYYHLTDPKIKPRDIICYINDIVALKKIWKEEIEFKYLALFAVKRTQIMGNPFDSILSKNYLDTLSLIFRDDPYLSTNIAALAFNVPKDIAVEILLKKPIENALKGTGNLLQVSSDKSFFTIFDSVFWSFRPDFINTVSCLNELTEDNAKNPKMEDYWRSLAENIISIDLFEIKYINSIRLLLEKLKSVTHKKNVLQYLFLKAISPDKENNKLFKGRAYYELIESTDVLLKKVWPEKSVIEFLPNNTIKAEEFFDFVSTCPETFSVYNVNCNVDEVNEYLIEKFESNEISNDLTLVVAVSKHIDLTGLIDHVKNKISEIIPTLPKFELFIKDVYAIGKLLSKDGNLIFNIPSNIAIPLINSNKVSDTQVDLLLSIISENIIKPDMNPQPGVNPGCKNILNDVKFQDEFIKSYKYFFNYVDLIKYNLQFPSPLGKAVLNELTENPSIVVNGTEVEFLIINYNIIEEQILNSTSSIFIDKVDSFYSKIGTKFVTAESLSVISNVIEDNYKRKNNLMSDIISQANKYLQGLDKNTWLEALKKAESSETIKLFKTLLETKTYQSDKLSQAADIAYCDFMESIAKNENDLPVDSEFWEHLFTLSSNSHYNTFINVRDSFLVPTHGEVSIEKLSFFEDGLFRYGKLDQDSDIADEVLRRIFIPLASTNETYVEILRHNTEIIKKIVEKANNSIVDFKNALELKCQTIINDGSFIDVWALLLKKFNDLSPKPNLEETKPE